MSYISRKYEYLIPLYYHQYSPKLLVSSSIGVLTIKELEKFKSHFRGEEPLNFFPKGVSLTIYYQ